MVAAYIITGIVLLLSAILWIPFRYQADGSLGSDMSVSLRVDWFFGLIIVYYTKSTKKSAMTIHIAGIQLKKRKSKSTDKKDKKKRKANINIPAAEHKTTTEEPTTSADTPVKPKKTKQTKRDKRLSGLIEKLKSVKALLTEYDLKIIIGLSLRFIQKTLRSLKPKRLDIDGVIGLDDPYQTGLLMGFYETAAGIGGFRQSIQLSGDFNKRILAVNFKLKGQIRLGGLLWPVIWFCLQKPIFRIIISMLK